MEPHPFGDFGFSVCNQQTRCGQMVCLQGEKGVKKNLSHPQKVTNKNPPPLIQISIICIGSFFLFFHLVTTHQHCPAFWLEKGLILRNISLKKPFYTLDTTFSCFH